MAVKKTDVLADLKVLNPEIVRVKTSTKEYELLPVPAKRWLPYIEFTDKYPAECGNFYFLTPSVDEKGREAKLQMFKDMFAFVAEVNNIPSQELEELAFHELMDLALGTLQVNADFLSTIQNRRIEEIAEMYTRVRGTPSQEATPITSSDS
jgi:hypothetical protein